MAFSCLSGGYAIEVHNRLNALGPIPERLYVLPQPDAGGAVPLFAPDPATRGPAVTKAWSELERQLKSMVGLCLVMLDPLQPLCALDLNVPENAQFVFLRATHPSRTGKTLRRDDVSVDTVTGHAPLAHVWQLSRIFLTDRFWPTYH